MAWKDRYARPGPGIPKDAPKKKGIFLFLDILQREFWELMKLNLLFVVFCIPIVTIPAALTAMTRVTGKMCMDENHFLWGDFWGAFCKEWKPSAVGGWAILLIMGVSLLGASFYGSAVTANFLFVLPLGMCLAIGLIALISSFYFFPMCALIDLPLKQILRNSMLLALSCLGKNLLAAAVFLICAFFLVVGFFYFIWLILFITCSFLNLVCTFIAYDGLKKYVIQDAANPESESQ